MAMNLRQIIKEEVEDFDGGLEYIDNHYNEMKSKLDNIKNRMIKDLPIISKPSDEKGVIRIVNYKDMNSWPTTPHISDTLIALANKIEHMIDTGKLC